MNDEETPPAENRFIGIFGSFFSNSKKSKPDPVALAKLLRSDEPLPDGFRWGLAEVFDPKYENNLTCNWHSCPSIAVV
jgi:hypothetical protein